MNFKTLEWIGDANGTLRLIDQRKLPGQFTRLDCKNLDQLYIAIQTLAVRGAPAIGVAAAYGAALILQAVDNTADINFAIKHLNEKLDYLATSRPTAVNLFWAIDKIKKTVANSHCENIDQLKKLILNKAIEIHNEDIQMCKAIGHNGQHLITENCTVLTHCNAGALATAGQGTALSPMFEAHSNDRKFKVFVDETRPLLQGSRLTAWELTQAGIEAVLICDNMAGWLMKQKMVDLIITGADRIAANGDTANKIGTYSLSVLAKNHSIPFYIAAPSSTFDLSLETGDQIPIEQRNASEVCNFGDCLTSPENIAVYNPAFDVTPAENITAIITEKGLIQNPNKENLTKYTVLD